MPRERRIEVRLGDGEALEKWASFECDECGEWGEEEVWFDAPESLGGLLARAEKAGLDPGREFRMRYHSAHGYVEFWQVPTPVPSMPAAALKAAS